LLHTSTTRGAATATLSSLPLLGALAIASTAACGSNEPSTGAGPSTTSDAGPDGGSALDPLFTDPNVPRCDNNLSTQFQLQGQLEGQAIHVGTIESSNLDKGLFETLDVVDGAVVTGLVLTWSAPLTEDVAVPLTGSRFVVPDGQPLAGKSFCVTAGKFGSPRFVPDASAGRTLLFQITGAKEGTCTGNDAPVALSGCIFRTNTFFPQ
jgi:hypothetical protein